MPSSRLTIGRPVEGERICMKGFARPGMRAVWMPCGGRRSLLQPRFPGGSWRNDWRLSTICGRDANAGQLNTGFGLGFHSEVNIGDGYEVGDTTGD